MGLFSKTEVVEAVLPFEIREIPPDCDEEYEVGELGGLIDFEAYGRVGDQCEENQYYYAMVGCSNIVYEEFVDTLTTMPDKNLKILAKVKNGKVKSFKIDFKDLALKLQDEKYEKLFIADGWVADKSSLYQM